MADNSIDDIYEELRALMLDLNFKEAKEYFDRDNIPDSLADNSFIIAPMPIDPGELAVPQAGTIQVFNLKPTFLIDIGFDLPANNIIAKMKTVLLKVESIIKAVLAVVVSEDEKDRIVFAGAVPFVSGTSLVYEIGFDIDYRIKNI
jgi:hypothetical protein